jgi:uncharacterized protein
MHHFLPLKRLASDPRGDYHAQIFGKSGGAQSDSPPAERSGSAQSGNHCPGVGHRIQSPPCGCGASFPSLGSGNSEAVAAVSAGQFSRAMPGGTSRALLALIRVYQLFISPLLPPSCRFVPTCSAYAYEAVQKWGVCWGAWYAFRRLLRCHPWGGHGYDPVP